MKIIREASFEEVQKHLDYLGSFNKEDTKNNIEPHKYFYLVELVKEEFLNNVFLSNNEVRHIVPENSDRKLGVVAGNAKRNLEEGKNLGEGGWKLTRIIAKTEDWIRSKSALAPIVLRDLKETELEISGAFKYIHDGCHRSLGYAMKILGGEIKYKKINAYLATNFEEKINPKGLGFAIVADLWLWGAMAFFTPTLFSITSDWKWFFSVTGLILVLISFAGALLEVENYVNREVWGYWGVSLLFLVPSILLFILILQQIVSENFLVASKIIAMILLTIGGPMFFQGVPYLFDWKKSTQKGIFIQPEQKKKANFEIIGNILVALFSLVTAIVALIRAFL